MYSLDGKVVLITGAANGIGATVVKDCLQEGVKHISFLDIDETSGTKLEQELKVQYGGTKVRFIKCDVSKEGELLDAFNAITNDQGYVDVVINNAGLADESTPEAIRRAVEVNFLAVVNSTIKAIELMRVNQGGKGGTVINVSSVAALCQLSPALFLYAGTKLGILHFSSCIGKPVYASKTGVRVLTVCFGLTDTDIIRKINSFDEVVNDNLENALSRFPSQTKESASKGLLDAYKKGETGSTWLITNNKPALDYTAMIEDAFKILLEKIFD